MVVETSGWVSGIAIACMVATAWVMVAKVMCAIECALEARREAKEGSEHEEHLRLHKEMLAEDEFERDIWVADAANQYLDNKAMRSCPQPETATCHICGKRDFMDNLADVGWMGSPPKGSLLVKPEMYTMAKAVFDACNAKHAHPSCAKIHRSDDGKGWVKDCDCKGKK